MAGLAAPAGDGEADGPATATSELVALWHRAVTGAAPAPEARLQALRQLPGRTATVRFVEVERARAAGEVTRAADLACQGVDELLAASGAEHAVRALHQLASVCVAAGRADEALERLRRWLAMFPDSPGTPAVWLVLAELGAHAAAVPGPPLQRLLGAARDAVTHATRFLADDDPALVRVAGRLVTLTAGARAEAACGVREEPAPGPERCPP
jgi:hypothetical protein